MTMYPMLIAIKKNNINSVIHIRENWSNSEKSIQFYYLKKIINSYADQIIAINKTSFNLIKGNAKIDIVYDWIDFSSRDKKISFKNIFGDNFSKYKVFLFLGGTNWMKGAKEVIKVFSEKIQDKNSDHF